MIGAIVINDMVENIIVLNEDQIPEMEAALSCEIVKASTYGLTFGDLRTSRGWTRNIDGEQVILEELTEERKDGYDLAIQRAEAAENDATTLLSILEGE